MLDYLPPEASIYVCLVENLKSSKKLPVDGMTFEYEQVSYEDISKLREWLERNGSGAYEPGYWSTPRNDQQFVDPRYSFVQRMGDQITGVCLANSNYVYFFAIDLSCRGDKKSFPALLSKLVQAFKENSQGIVFVLSKDKHRFALAKAGFFKAPNKVLKVLGINFRNN